MSSTTVTSSETGETVQTQTADIKFEIELDQVTVQAQDGGQATKDPLVLDLNHDGVISVTNPDSGVVFDIDGDGAKDRSAFATGGDGFLALDRNQNGVIDDGTELFGDQNGSANGFLELGKYDSNGDGKIDAADPVFSSLRILTADKDGSMILQALGAYTFLSMKKGKTSYMKFIPQGYKYLMEGLDNFAKMDFPFKLEKLTERCRSVEKVIEQKFRS